MRLNFLVMHIMVKSMGCHYSLDWTTGLEYWTGLLEWRFLLFGQDSVVFQIFDTWRPQLFFRISVILQCQHYNDFMTCLTFF